MIRMEKRRDELDDWPQWNKVDMSSVNHIDMNGITVILTD